MSPIEYWNLGKERYLLELSKINALLTWCEEELDRLNQHSPIRFEKYDPTQASTAVHRAQSKVEDLLEEVSRQVRLINADEKLNFKEKGE